MGLHDGSGALIERDTRELARSPGTRPCEHTERRHPAGQEKGLRVQSTLQAP